jgi:hypothetical protein
MKELIKILIFILIALVVYVVWLFAFSYTTEILQIDKFWEY